MIIGNMNIEWIGHATFRIRHKGMMIYFDPYILDKSPEKADIILVTHEHFDHCDNEKIQQIIKPDSVIIANANSAKKLSGNIKIIEEGKDAKERGVSVKAVSAYNIGKQYHPRGLGIGFIIDLGGTRIYHAGDTDLIPEMTNYKCDIALLPIGGTYTMNEKEAADAAISIQPKIVVPMHFNFIKGTEAKPEVFEKHVADNSIIEVKILKPLVKPTINI